MTQSDYELLGLIHELCVEVRKAMPKNEPSLDSDDLPQTEHADHAIEIVSKEERKQLSKEKDLDHAESLQDKATSSSSFKTCFAIP